MSKRLRTVGDRLSYEREEDIEFKVYCDVTLRVKGVRRKRSGVYDASTWCAACNNYQCEHNPEFIFHGNM